MERRAGWLAQCASNRKKCGNCQERAERDVRTKEALVRRPAQERARGDYDREVVHAADAELGFCVVMVKLVHLGTDRGTCPVQPVHEEIVEVFRGGARSSVSRAHC